MSYYEEHQESPEEENKRLKIELLSLKRRKSQLSLQSENLKLTDEIKKLRIELGLEDDYQPW